MKIFLIICLASGLASSEKLDRRYLPPPGSKFSGGTPGDIETPLEFPKQSTGPQQGNGKPEIEIGINQRPSPSLGIPDSQKPGFYFPKTTTSYAITQTTTFAPDDKYTGTDQPSGLLNGTMVQSGFPGHNQPIRRPGQGPYNQNRPGQTQTSILTPYGTTAPPQFPGIFSGPEYLPPVSNTQSPAQVISNQNGPGIPSGLPQGPKYQDGQVVSGNQPGYESQQNQFVGNLNIPSTTSPQYQGGRFVPKGPSSQQPPNQFSESQFPSSTAVPQYHAGQRFITPGSNQQNQFIGSQLPTSTAAPQYQDGQRLFTPESNQEQFTSNQEFPSSTAQPRPQFRQPLTTPKINQVFGASLPNQQDQFTGYQYKGNQNFLSSTATPTSGPIEQSQFPGNQNFPINAVPNYQDGQGFTTPGQIQGAQFSGHPEFGSRFPTQNQFTGQNFPTSTSAPQFQDGTRLSTPGFVQEGYGTPVLTKQNQNQYPGNQNYPSSTTAPQYQTGQQFTTPGPISNQNFPSTAAPDYQVGLRFTNPGQFPDQQTIGSRLPGQQSQSTLNLNYPSSTSAPQYQDSQRLSTPGVQENFGSAQPNQQNEYPGNQQFATSTVGPQYQDSQRLSTPGVQENFGSAQPNQQNEYPGNQQFATSTVGPQYQDSQRDQYGNQNINQVSTNAPQYQGQRITTPGQLINQSIYPGSTTAPQYQKTFEPNPGANQQGVILSQQDQFQRPVSNQQFPTPSGFNQGSQSQHDNNNVPTSGKENVFTQPQGGFPVSQSYGNTQQPNSQTAVGSPVFGGGIGFPSATVESLPERNLASIPAGANRGGRPERPQAEGDRNAEILNYENILTPEGYFYSYDTSNGIHADETGTVGNGTRAQGSFSYTGDDGKVYTVVYSADENGFQPRGDHLPTPPPIPDAIQRVIDQANKDKDSGIEDDGSYNEEKYGYMKYEPVTRINPQNRTVSVVNGSDIPENNGPRIGGQTTKTFKTKGRKPVSSTGNSEQFLSDNEETEMGGSAMDKGDTDKENRRDENNKDKNMEKKRRISSKRPKPTQNLSVEDNKNGLNMPIKSTKNSKAGSSQEYQGLDGKGSDQESAPDDTIGESEDNDDSQESQGLDYDSDLVNYKDDPNNRTDFHGLNKYLPESKKSNKKNQPAKKRPVVRVNGNNQPIEVYGAKGHENRPDLADGTHARAPSRKNKIGQRVKDQSKVTGQALRDNDDEANADSDDRTDTDEEYGSDDIATLVTNNRIRKPGASNLNKKIAGKPKRPHVNERPETSTPDDKKNEPSSYEDNGYEYTPPQRKFGPEEAIKYPSRVNQKESQTTLRPFMTKNVFGDETEPVDEYNGEYDADKPGRRPMSGQKQYPGYDLGGERYVQNSPKVNGNERYSTTRRPVSYGTSRPFGRPQITDDNNPEVIEDGGFSTTRRPVSYGTSRPFGRPQTTDDNNPQVIEDGGFSTTRRPVSYGTSRPFGRQQTTDDNNPQVIEDGGFSTTRRPVSYGTSRPFGRPQTTDDNNPQVIEDGGFSTTRRPVSYGTSRPFGRPQTTDDNNPQVIEDGGISTTRRPVSYGTSRPFGRPQTTGLPQYQDQRMTGQLHNKPGDKLFYNTNAPTIGTGGNVFSSTTPLPQTGPGYKYQRPGYQNNPSDGLYSDSSVPNSENFGANIPSDQVPRTTHRPNYSFGDKISSPVTVDGFGRPIQSTNAPAFDKTLRPTYSTVRPSQLDNRPSSVSDQFQPTEGRFGVTSTQRTPGYQSTSTPIGEDFSGPKQSQRFDPITGYHYK